MSVLGNVLSDALPSSCLLQIYLLLKPSAGLRRDSGRRLFSLTEAVTGPGALAAAPTLHALPPPLRSTHPPPTRSDVQRLNPLTKGTSFLNSPALVRGFDGHAQPGVDHREESWYRSDSK